MAEGTVCRRGFSGDWFCGGVSLPAASSASAAPAGSASSAAPVESARTPEKAEEKCRYTRMAGDYVEVCEQKASQAPSSSILDGLSRLFGDILEILKQPNGFQKYRH